jgi:hypothetical protein
MTSEVLSTAEPITTLQLLRWAGERRLREILPSPLNAYVSDNSTGCQITIFAKDADGPTIDVWRESVWHDPIYDFNELGKVRGLQPGCEWARDTLIKVFADLEAEYRKAKAAYAERRALEADKKASQLSSAANRSAHMLREAKNV